MADKEQASDKDDVFALMRFNKQDFDWPNTIAEWEEFWRKANPAYPIHVKKQN